MDSVFEEATRRGEIERSANPRPISVRFDGSTERIVVEFENGASFIVPARLLEGLQSVSKDDLKDVELLGETGLHWEKLDVDFSVAGLMQGVFGSAKFLEAAKRGGQSRSSAKIAASRANGLKGGRPRQVR